MGVDAAICCELLSVNKSVSVHICMSSVTKIKQRAMCSKGVLRAVGLQKRVFSRKIPQTARPWAFGRTSTGLSSAD